MTKISFKLPDELRRRLERHQKQHIELRTRTAVLLKAIRVGLDALERRARR